MHCSLPCCSIHGILQAGILEWGAISFSRGSSRPGDRTWVCCIVGRHSAVWASRNCLSLPFWEWLDGVALVMPVSLVHVCKSFFRVTADPVGSVVRRHLVSSRRSHHTSSPISVGWVRITDAPHSCYYVVGSHQSGRYEILAQYGFMFPHLLMTLNMILYFYGCIIFWNCVLKCICVFTCLFSLVGILYRFMIFFFLCFVSILSVHGLPFYPLHDIVYSSVFSFVVCALCILCMKFIPTPRFSG